MWEGLNKHSFVKMLPSRGLTSRYMLFLIIFSVHQLNPGSGVALDTRSRWEKSEGLNGKVGSFVSILALNATRLIIQDNKQDCCSFGWPWNRSSLFTSLL